MRLNVSGLCKKTAVMLLPICFPALAEKQPNILFILTDDQGYGDMGRTGNPILKTPNMDRLYDQSVRFTDFCTATTCAPSRSALLTGIHPFRNGVTHTLPPRSNTALDRVLLPELLRQAGYKTAHFGKWHLGDGPEYDPQSRGFDYTATIAAPQKNFFDPPVIRNGHRIQGNGFREDVLFDEAIKFMAEHRDGPFFCYVCSWSPHAPLCAPEEDIAPYRKLVDNEKTATFLGMVANLDKNIGRILQKLDELGLRDDTIVILMNDNGGTYGVDVHNAGMRGTKATSWIGGVRVFSLWSWPGKWIPQDVDVLTDAVDVLPTLCELAGADLPETIREEKDGFSLVPLLKGQTGDWAHGDRMTFQHNMRWAGGMAAAHKYSEASVRWKNYMLVRREPAPDPLAIGKDERQGSNLLLNWVKQGKSPSDYSKKALWHWALTDGWALYDVHVDPDCNKNLIAEQPELADRMEKAYETWWDKFFPEMMKNGGDAKLNY